MSTKLLERTEEVEDDVTTEERSDTLNASHRCDKCGAAAFIRTVLKSGNDLLFCGHHYHENAKAIEPFLDSDKFIDERWKLTWDRHTGTENS